MVIWSCLRTGGPGIPPPPACRPRLGLPCQGLGCAAPEAPPDPRRIPRTHAGDPGGPPAAASDISLSGYCTDPVIWPLHGGTSAISPSRRPPAASQLSKAPQPGQRCPRASAVCRPLVPRFPPGATRRGPPLPDGPPLAVFRDLALPGLTPLLLRLRSAGVWRTAM